MYDLKTKTKTKMGVVLLSGSGSVSSVILVVIIIVIVVLVKASQQQGPTPISSGSSVSSGGIEVEKGAYEKVITKDQYYEILATRGITPSNVKPLFTYESFMKAITTFKGFSLSSDLTVAKREIACLLTHVAHEVAFQYTEQLCAPHNVNCREKLGDKSTVYGRGSVQLSTAPNYEEFSKYVFGDTRLLQDPDMILRDPMLFWGTGAWFYMMKLKQYMIKNPPEFKMTTWRVCCFCTINADDGRTRGETYKSICKILGTTPGPDDQVYAEKGVRLTDGDCF